MSGIRGMAWPQLRCRVCGGAPDRAQGFIERVDFSPGGESWGVHRRCAEETVRRSRLERTDATPAKAKPARKPWLPRGEPATKDWLSAPRTGFLP